MQATAQVSEFRRALREPAPQPRPAPERAPSKQSLPIRDFARLSFVEIEVDDEGNMRPNLWAVGRSGNYREDTRLGASYANELIAHARAFNMPGLVTQVIKSVFQGGQWGGVEIGFFHQFTMLAMRAPR